MAPWGDLYKVQQDRCTQLRASADACIWCLQHLKRHTRTSRLSCLSLRQESNAGGEHPFLAFCSILRQVCSFRCLLDLQHQNSHIYIGVGASFPGQAQVRSHRTPCRWHWLVTFFRFSSPRRCQRLALSSHHARITLLGAVGARPLIAPSPAAAAFREPTRSVAPARGRWGPEAAGIVPGDPSALGAVITMRR